MSSPQPGSRRVAPSTAGPTSSRPPSGVVIICIVGAIGVAFTLLGSLVALAASPILGLAFLALAAGYAFVLVGLWRLERWAWKWGLVLYGLGAFLDLLSANVIGLLISVLVVVYLLAIEDEFA